MNIYIVLHHLAFEPSHIFLTHCIGKNITDAERKLILRVRKTGKSYVETMHQLKLFGLIAMLWVKWGKAVKRASFPLDISPLGRFIRP